MTRRHTIPLLVFATLTTLASFYLFARFTVDDAFITWRYGRNLISHGIWAYNPTVLDITQAYTNPIYALLSIVPAFAGWDVVLFFKLVSLLLIAGFLAMTYRISERKDLGLLLGVLFLGVPASMVHAFSGLETFLFVVGLGFLFVAIATENLQAAVILALVLIFTRPEAWLLIGLVPGYFFLLGVWRGVAQGAGLRASIRTTPVGSAIWAGGFLLAVFAIYAGFHCWHFGRVLPNTFYVKANAGFNLINFAIFTFYLSPVLMVFVAGRKREFFFIVAVFVPIIYVYATSALQMNYIDRFAYQVFGPIYVFLSWMAVRNAPAIRPSERPLAEARRRHRVPIAAIAIAQLAAFCFASSSSGELLHIANYYPRALKAHAALGRALDLLRGTGEVHSFSLGDAGMAAFHSRLVALDPIGLGSALVTRQGMTEDTLQRYAPDVIVFHARLAGIRKEMFGQATLLDWARQRDYGFVCDFYWKPDYILRIFAKRPSEVLMVACRRSREANDMADLEFLKMHIFKAPWQFWRE